MTEANKDQLTPGGTIQATAGSQLPQGDRPCKHCDGRGYFIDEMEIDGRVGCFWCNCTGVEPEGAPRPGTSALGPPVPSVQDAEQREAANRASTAGPSAEDAPIAARWLKAYAEQLDSLKLDWDKWPTLSRQRAWAEIFSTLAEIQAVEEGGPNV